MSEDTGASDDINNGSTSSDFDRLEEARRYFRKNYNVLSIPLPGEVIESWDEQNKKYIKKIADGKSSEGYGQWKSLILERQTAEDFENRFRNRQNCNIAIVTGKVSGVFSLDVDGPQAFDYLEKRIQEVDDEEIGDAVKNTLRTRTGGGNLQFLFGCNPSDFDNEEDIPSWVLWKGTSNDNEVRLKGHGGYAIVPHSISQSGRVYEFENGETPVITLSKEKIYLLISILEHKSKEKTFEADTDARENTNHSRPILMKVLTEDSISNILNVLKGYYEKGSRNDINTWLCGLLFKQNVNYESARKLVIALCHAANDEEKNSRLTVLYRTYEIGKKGQLISGFTNLVEIIAKKAGEEAAKNLVIGIIKIINSPKKYRTYQTTNRLCI